MQVIFRIFLAFLYCYCGCFNSAEVHSVPQHTLCNYVNFFRCCCSLASFVVLLPVPVHCVYFSLQCSTMEVVFSMFFIIRSTVISISPPPQQRSSCNFFLGAYIFMQIIEMIILEIYSFFHLLFSLLFIVDHIFRFNENNLRFCSSNGVLPF